MKTKIKVLGLASILALALGVVTMNVDVQDLTQANATAKFTMVDGASVRIPSDAEKLQNKGSGIRFTAKMNQTYVTEKFANATNVTLWSKVENTSNSEQVFTKSWVLKGNNAITLSYNESDEAVFNHAIMFDSLINSTAENAEELMARASALDLKGTMWLDVDGEPVQVDNVQEVDTIRSARIVAYTAYQANNSLESLSEYVNNIDSTLLIKENSDDQAFFETGAEEALTLTYGTNARYDLDLYDGLEKIGVNKDLTASDFENGLGSTISLLGFDAQNNVYHTFSIFP